MDTSRSASSCVCSLGELLREIFSYRVIDDYEIPSPIKAPLVLGHVNRKWRAIAFGDPLLWSRAYFCLDPKVSSTQRLMQGYISAITFWMDQSQQTLIDLRLDIHRINRPRFQGADILAAVAYSDRCRVLILGIVNRLLDHKDRWRNIDLKLPSFAYDVIYNNLTSRYPNLEVFRLRQYYDDSMPSRLQFEISMTPSQKLVDVHLSLSEPYSLILPSAFPTTLQALSVEGSTLYCNESMLGSRLRKLSLHNVRFTYEEFAKLPKIFTLLEELSLNDERWEVRIPDNDARSVVTFLGLLSLELSAISRFPLSIMTAPDLEYLTVRQADDDVFDEDFDTGILAFLVRSKPPITRFSYQNNWVPCELMAQMLQEMQELSELHVFGTPLPSQVLEALSKASFCPNLRVLRNDLTHSEYFMPNSLSPEPNNAEDILELLQGRFEVDLETQEVKLESLYLFMQEEEYQMLCDRWQHMSPNKPPTLTMANTYECTQWKWTGVTSPSSLSDYRWHTSSSALGVW